MINKIYIAIAVAFSLMLTLMLAFGGGSFGSLKENHINVLFYNEFDVPDNVVKIAKGTISNERIFNQYVEENDDMVKFNLIAIINIRLQNSPLMKNDPAVGKIIDAAIDDQHPWIRAELLGVISRCNPTNYKKKIIDMLSDKRQTIVLGAYLCIESSFPLNEITPALGQLDQEKIDRFDKLVKPHYNLVELNKMANADLKSYKKLK